MSNEQKPVAVKDGNDLLNQLNDAFWRPCRR